MSRHEMVPSLAFSAGAGSVPGGEGSVPGGEGSAPGGLGSLEGGGLGSLPGGGVGSSSATAWLGAAQRPAPNSTERAIRLARDPSSVIITSRRNGSALKKFLNSPLISTAYT